MSDYHLSHTHHLNPISPCKHPMPYFRWQPGHSWDQDDSGRGKGSILHPMQQSYILMCNGFFHSLSHDRTILPFPFFQSVSEVPVPFFALCFGGPYSFLLYYEKYCIESDGTGFPGTSMHMPQQEHRRMNGR